MKKRRVSATLHSELTEYTSLLRALRTNDALDVTKHLTNAPSFARLDDPDAINISSSSSPMAGPSDLNHANNFDFADESDNGSSRKGKSRENSMPARNRRDHWTRWPLLLNDVLPPKWTLDDEIAVIASQTLKRRPSPQFPVPCESLDGQHTGDEPEIVHARDLELDEDDPDLPFFVPFLTTTIANYLVTLLSLLNAHTPARPASMQNRIEPLDWRAVIDVIVCSGIQECSNPKIVENVIKRLEAIYGPPPMSSSHQDTPFRAIDRIKRKVEMDSSFNAIMEREIDQLFSKPILRPSGQGIRKQSKSSEPVPDTGYRARIRGVKRQRSAPQPEITSAQEAAQVDAGETGTRRSRRTKSVVNYYIPPPPDMEET
ncbi:hypothetical protein BJ165DRAFT_1528223 [Panaeolus papilionaceus]|nr:hypothetical protein BJ165DRAFT_1528223 [Panaeolus papilionaceus]